MDMFGRMVYVDWFDFCALMQGGETMGTKKSASKKKGAKKRRLGVGLSGMIGAPVQVGVAEPTAEPAGSRGGLDGAGERLCWRPCWGNPAKREAATASDIVLLLRALGGVDSVGWCHAADHCAAPRRGWSL